MNQNPEQLPSLPGVYLFKHEDTLLYVGKAKNLKKRVSSYFQKQKTDWKIQALVEEHTHIEHIVTHSETDALLLEAQLIRAHKPKFNVLLKSGQPFVYLLFTQEELPRFELVRNKMKKGIYFGPFLHKGKVRAAHAYLMRAFQLSLCSTKIQNGCLNFHVGNCAGNCLANFDKEAYIFRLFLAQNLLEGNYAASLKSVKEKIAQHVKDLEFEKAHNVHRYLQNLEIIFETLKTRYSLTKYEKDIALATAPMRRIKEEDFEVGKKVQELFHLEKAPATIDCFDISHFQSRYIVGACIRFTNGVPDKNSFRRFKIRTLKEQNDYAALQEVVTRRYKNPAEIPDLVVIDGGLGQLHAIEKILPNAQIISLAKREELVFSKSLTEPIKLSLHSEVGKLIISLRDYAHHFAISYHKLLRSKQMAS
jgi:excinuclease ABC subunit C